GVMTLQPPVIKRALPVLVPKVDADGNETSGVPSPLHQAPLGTYLGWNVTRAGFYKGRGCGFAGGFIPFAKTESQTTVDRRPALIAGRTLSRSRGLCGGGEEGGESVIEPAFSTARRRRAPDSSGRREQRLTLRGCYRICDLWR